MPEGGVHQAAIARRAEQKRLERERLEREEPEAYAALVAEEAVKEAERIARERERGRQRRAVLHFRGERPFSAERSC